VKPRANIVGEDATTPTAIEREEPAASATALTPPVVAGPAPTLGRHRRRWVLLLGAAAAAAAVAALRLTLFAPLPVPVRVVAVERARVEETVTNSRAGTVKARRRAKLSPEAGGRVAELPFREGARVRRGDVLVRMDDALSRARLEVAEREEAAARAEEVRACLAAERAARERERTESLASDGVVSVDLLDAATTAARLAQAGCEAAGRAAERAHAARALAATDLDKTRLRAPFAGVVAELTIEAGEWTTPSPPGLPIPAVLDLIDASALYVSAPMDEVDSARIRAGQAARVTVDSHPGRSFPGRVARVAPYVLDLEAQNRTVEIEVELEGAEGLPGLLPGTSADVEVVLSARDGVLRIPTSALLEGGKVLMLDGDRLSERSVVPGIRNWDFTEVRSGLGAGDGVVVSFDRPEIRAGARARAAP
jgi:HlyD family secretion protein